MDSKNQKKFDFQPAREFDAQLAKTVFIVFALITFSIDFFINGKGDQLKIFYLKLFIFFYLLALLFQQSHFRFSITRKISQLTALVTKIYIPRGIRHLLFSFYSDQYKVIKSDLVKPFEEYTSFNDFFTRQVKPRYINPDRSISVCPADSKILSISQIHSDDCLLVKGIRYNLGHFLTGRKEYKMCSDTLNSQYKRHQNSTVWSCIFYLAPGDYHRYHSPVDFLAKQRRHILGSLAPVKESYISKKKGVYEGNERVVLEGEWDNGFMFLTFVGAMNVGSMTVNFDKKLNTNVSFTYPFYESMIQNYHDEKFLNQVNKPYETTKEGVMIPKGCEIGRFNLGSTVVMVFESNKDVKWNITPGQKVRFGEPIFSV